MLETKVRQPLPLGVYLLAFSLFAMGSAEFLLAGVLPAIADDLDISLSAQSGVPFRRSAAAALGVPLSRFGVPASLCGGVPVASRAVLDGLFQ
ncbi:hypothetical protein [Nonomuraea typhae]|uniref:MFS transporter n=1 Tax=Nonomuraea typhae TaxID=2603600 RepID=A0ABW7Z2H8_9ACTN